MGEQTYIDLCRNINIDFLELYGSQYVIEHVVAEWNIRTDRQIYNAYTSDLLKVIAESLGAEVHSRYSELIDKTEKEEKTGDEIALEIIERAGLKV